MTIYQGIKQLITPSSTGIGAISSGAGVYTGNSSPVRLDTGRKVTVWSTGDISSLVLTITGTIEGGQQKIESIAGSTDNASPRMTSWDFLTVSSVSASSAPNTAILIGTSSVGATPWLTVPAQVGGSFTSFATLTLTSTSNGMTCITEATAEDVTQTVPSAVCTLSTAAVIVPFVPSSVTFGLTSGNPGSASLSPGPQAYRVVLTSSSSAAGWLRYIINFSGGY